MVNSIKYIGKDESNILKGFLIFLIILAHNNILLPVSSFTWSLIYTFHRTCFFILPFFYEWSPKGHTTSYISKLIARTWIPYFITSCMVLGISLYLESVPELSLNTFFAFLNGNEDYCEKYLGGRFLWFLPSFCSFSILLFFSRKNRLLQYMIAMLGFVVWGVDKEQFSLLASYTFGGLPLALSYYASGFVCKKIYDYFVLSRHLQPFKVCIYIFIALTMLLGISYGNSIYYKMIDLYKFIMPIIAFISLFYISIHVKSKFVKFMGKHSLPIYLLHLFVYNALIKILGDQFWSGLLNLVLTILITSMMAYIISKCRYLRKLYTPRDFNEFIHFYK